MHDRSLRPRDHGSARGEAKTIFKSCKELRAVLLLFLEVAARQAWGSWTSHDRGDAGGTFFSASGLSGCGLCCGSRIRFAGRECRFSTEPPPSGSAATSDVPTPQARALVLVVGQGPVLVPPSRSVVLQCSPRGGGTHPRTQEACALLRPVSGDLQKIKPPVLIVCTREYQPVTVSSVGVWDDHFVLSLRTFTNKGAALWSDCQRNFG
ncbi:hypothetical protein DQ384_10745 [Sphaerisporangium album]|uniref:Subtilisin inhibitor domain-containing protein n=1 Tax=Sphaerisporangium album TaxID=509200 RepID=A0A367FMY5_9ACTN|nr:hypothetical protein DQ384_10745 [Sphaerisporangium album]